MLYSIKNSPKIKMSAITWNMGNEAASRKVAEEFITQITFSDGAKPEIIALATQEEMAPNGKRLQDLMLQQLNQGLPLNEQYVLVQTKEPQFHKTMAGANHSFVTLSAALLTSANRVSCALFVKKPCTVEFARAQIDFEPGKEKGNKSVITIKGVLKVPGCTPVDLVVSGGHFNAQSEEKRRSHALRFLEALGIKTPYNKNFEQLYREAKAIKVLMGDFNERDKLMKSGNITDEMAKTVYTDFGYDIELKPELVLGERTLHGTYGFRFSEEDPSKQITNRPDVKREHVATGGYLDRIAISSGLMTENLKYGNTLNQDNFKLNKSKKWCYHYADHLPVVRNFSIDLPHPQANMQVVAQYIKKHIPHFQDERAEYIFLVRKCRGFEQLKQRASEMIYHDSLLTPSQYLQNLSGVKINDYEAIMEALQKKGAQKELLMELSEKINILIDNASKNGYKSILENIYNSIRQCNELRNAMREVAALSPVMMSDEKKASFLNIATELVDLYYIEKFSALLNVEHGMEAKISEAERKMNEYIYTNPGLFDNFAMVKAKHFNLFERNAR